jgi:hypothetical protein
MNLPGKPASSEKKISFEKINLLVAISGLFITFLLSSLVADLDIFPYVALVISAIAFCLYVYKASDFPVSYKAIFYALIIIISTALAYGNWWASRPHFEVVALGTLEGDKNTYELTDNLLLNSWNLDNLGAALTFRIEVIPNYFGKRVQGGIARISGDKSTAIEKQLWENFSDQSGTVYIDLSLQDLLSISSIPFNAEKSSFSDNTNNLQSQQTQIKIELYREVDKTDRLGNPTTITIRNTPWGHYSKIVRRNGHQEIDLSIKNSGGEGKFKIHLNLARLDKGVSTGAHPIWDAGTLIKTVSYPDSWVELDRGESFPYTIQLTDPLPYGTYAVEVYTIKQQNFATVNGANWDSYNNVWLFGNLSDVYVFIVPRQAVSVDQVIQTEVDRLKNENGIDLGTALLPAESYSSKNIQGQKQVFANGEVYSNGAQAFALFGPILEYYKNRSEKLGFPTSIVETHTASAGKTRYGMNFENAFVYSSESGTYSVEGWFLTVYRNNGGGTGWMGYPASEVIQSPEGTLQLFEKGYLIKYNPLKADGSRDFEREPESFAYTGSRGSLFDVRSTQSWQDTGIKVQPDDRIHILQVGGGWTNQKDTYALFDANGNSQAALSEESLLPSLKIGTLVGRVGEGEGQSFNVDRWGIIPANAQGNLYLAMNDDYYGDNNGLITVEIFVEPKVETSSPTPEDLKHTEDNNIWYLVNYHELTQPDKTEFSATVNQGSRWRLNYAWCVTSPVKLEDNLKAITQYFLVNGNPVPEKDIVSYNDSNQDKTMTCYRRATMLSNWRRDSDSTVELVITLANPVFDGSITYPAGEYRYVLNLNVERKE